MVGTIGVALDITERRQIEADFRLARLIQQRLLPKSGPTLADFDIAGICRPTDATGGDFFDFVPMRDGSLGVVVADVSSHGFAPALIMSSTRRVLRTLAALNDDLATIVAATNRAIYEDTASDPFVTLFFARIDPATRVMRYIGAGHDAYLLDGDGEVTHLASTAPPLGVFDGFDFCCTEPRTLRPGQLLILLTDGFAEAMAPDGSLFGIRRTIVNISKNRDGSAAEILEHLYQAICDYCHPQRPQDDVTGVIVKVNA